MGLSQKALAERLGTPGGQGEVSKWEKGKERPGPDKLAAIATLAGAGLELFQVETEDRRTNRAHELILRADADAGDRPPDISRLLDEAAEAGLTAEELEEVVRWASRQMKRAATAPPANMDPRYLAWLNLEADRLAQRALVDETTTPRNTKRRRPKPVIGNLGA